MAVSSSASIPMMCHQEYYRSEEPSLSIPCLFPHGAVQEAVRAVEAVVLLSRAGLDVKLLPEQHRRGCFPPVLQAQGLLCLLCQVQWF